MKTSGRLKWPSNGKLGFGSKNNGSTGNKWIHPQSALQDGHIAYLVKFLGSTEVEKAKGIDVVKDGIRKISFNQQLKKSEGAKPPKVELTVSINGVTIQEPKSKISSLSELPKQSSNYTSATLPSLSSHCHETSETNGSNSTSSTAASVGRKLEGLLLEDFKDDFNPDAVVNGFEEKQKKKPSQGEDSSLAADLLLLDAAPVKPLDPFGMSDFTTQEELESAIGLLDTRISEIRLYASGKDTLESEPLSGPPRHRGPTGPFGPKAYRRTVGPRGSKGEKGSAHSQGK